MAKGTRKVGITGRYGPRYGVKIRKQIKSVSRHRAKPQRCPDCQANAVKRVASGIWHCNHCKLKFAASAYSTRTRSFKREEAKTQEAIFQREDIEDLQEELAESGIELDDIVEERFTEPDKEETGESDEDTLETEDLPEE